MGSNVDACCLNEYGPDMRLLEPAVGFSYMSRCGCHCLRGCGHSKVLQWLSSVSGGQWAVLQLHYLLHAFVSSSQRQL